MAAMATNLHSAALSSDVPARHARATKVVKTSSGEDPKVSRGAFPTGLQAQFGRWGTVGALTVLSALLIVADVLTFGREMGVGWIIELFQQSVGGSMTELILVASLVTLLLARSGSPKKWTRRMSAKAFVDVGAASTACGVAARNTQKRWFDAGSDTTARSQPVVRKSTSTVTSKWNQAIDAAARQGNPEKAGQLLLEFERSGIQPECVSYNLVLRACAKRGDAKMADKWLRHMEDRGVQGTICSYNTLLDACAKSNNHVACEKWLRHMLEKGIGANVISFATAIYARARRGHVAEAEALLKEMLAHGIRPDAVCINSLIHACSVKADVAGAERWLQEMIKRGLETSVATYTAMIDACAKAGDLERAEHWFERMLEGEVEPNVVTFSAMIDACAKAGSLERAEHWHERMLARGVAPNAHSYTAVINACAKHSGSGGAEAAEQWLDHSEKAGVVNDVVVYSSVIDACGKAGDAERALRVFRRMRTSGLKPHIVAYAALARPFAYRGDWIKVESIAQDMAADGVVQNEYFVYAQLLAYAVARPHQVQRAEVCFRDALNAGVEANDHVVGVLARVVGRPRCAELMQELCGNREVPLPPQRRGLPPQHRVQVKTVLP